MGKLNAALFSSATGEWETPQELFNQLDKIWDFTLDVCATHANAKCRRYYTKKNNGLEQEWKGICWMNPPYGREIKPWIEKAYHESRKAGCIVVGLLPARTDTRWFHDYIYEKAKINFIKGRVKFVGGKSSAPFPSMIVIWGID